MYRLSMSLPCGRDLAERRRAIVRVLEPGWTFVDLCCGDCAIAPAVRDRSLVHEIVASADRFAVVAEPTRNWATGGSRLLRVLASRLARAAGDAFDERHSDASMADLVADFPPDAVRVLRLRGEAVVFVDAACVREAAAV